MTVAELEEAVKDLRRKDVPILQYYIAVCKSTPFDISKKK